MKRKEFVKSSIILAAGLPFVGCVAPTQNGAVQGNWNSGDVMHILPTVNHSQILISTSFRRKVNAPELSIGTTKVKGEMRDSKGLFWRFHISNLAPQTVYELQLFEGQNPLCDLWPLKTFPAPGSNPDLLKLMVYTCAGGHPEVQNMIPVPEHEREPPKHFAEKRKRLLKRGLSFDPDAIVVIGDTVYWDLHGNGKGRLGTQGNPMSFDIVGGEFDMEKSVLGTRNEDILRKAVDPQIIGLYGTACRSTPMFFFNDDHDYFENDEANDALVTFPPKPFNLELSRTVQRMYLPEFLPDENRPLDLPGSNAADRFAGSSEAFGTLRFGKLAELLMYDCRRFITLENASAVFLPIEVEHWLMNRTKSKDVKHTFHVPSTPYGWSAGKWLEWYPDVLGPDQKLHDDLPKYLYQKGWQAQHDRLVSEMYKAKHKKPIILNGDIHTFASGRIYRNGNLDMSDNPLNSFITGTMGCTVFPSTFRKIKASIPNKLKMDEDFDNIEENGFSIVEIDQKHVNVKMYKYLWSRDELNTIDHLVAFKTIIV